MKRIGITGSLASGNQLLVIFYQKTEARFLVDKFVKKLLVQIYSKKNFKKTKY